MGYIEEIRKLVGHRPIILVGAAVVLVNETGHILLQQRTYPKGKWGLPGGLMELGESTEMTACREVLEETGLHINSLQLIDVFSGPNHFSIAENGDEFYMVTIAYSTSDYEGDIQIDTTESMDVRFFHPDKLPTYLVGSHRLILENFFSSRKRNRV